MDAYETVVVVMMVVVVVVVMVVVVVVLVVVVVVVVLAQVPSASLVSSPPRLAGPQVEEPPESRILIYNKILPKTKRAQGIETLNFIE